MSDYPYRAPNLDDWLRDRDPSTVTLREAFDAGEALGADLQRGSVYQSLPDLAVEAEAAGVPLASYLQHRLLREQHEELPAELPYNRGYDVEREMASLLQVEVTGGGESSRAAASRAAFEIEVAAYLDEHAPHLATSTAAFHLAEMAARHGMRWPAETRLVRLRKEDCEPLLVPEDRVEDFAEAGWFPEDLGDVYPYEPDDPAAPAGLTTADAPTELFARGPQGAHACLAIDAARLISRSPRSLDELLDEVESVGWLDIGSRKFCARGRVVKVERRVGERWGAWLRRALEAALEERR